MKRSLYLLLVLVFWMGTALSQKVDSLYLVQHYDLAEYHIPMRDGAELFTVVYTPKNQDSKYPILMNRTCYNLADILPTTWSGTGTFWFSRMCVADT